MHGKHCVAFMSKRRSPFAIRNMDVFDRSKGKNPASVEEFLGADSFVSNSYLWGPTPPTTPPHEDPVSELPEVEESVDLTALMQIEDELDKKDFTIFDSMSMDISDLISFVSGSEIEDFMDQDESDMHSFPQHKKLCTEDVMIGDDIMWNESSASITSGLELKKTTTHDLFVEEPALQSDVLPSVGLTWQDRVASLDRSISHSADTPSESEEPEEDREVEVDVVTEHPSDLSLLVSPEQMSVRVKAKRAPAAKEPKVEIEMDPSDKCFCPSSSSTAGRHHHHHHVPVDHHNYSLPPSPSPRRASHTHSRHSSPESVCRDRLSGIGQKKGLSSHTMQSALQQVLQIKTGQVQDFGSQVYHTLHATRKGRGQKGQKRGRVGRPRSTPAGSGASNSGSVSSSPAASPAASPAPSVLSLGGSRHRSSVVDFEEDVDRRNQHNVLERNRRVLLQLKFQALRELVPSIRDQEKASKVQILKSAEHYIKDLRSQDARFQHEYKIELARYEALRKKEAQLKAQLKLKRKRDSSHHN